MTRGRQLQTSAKLVVHSTKLLYDTRQLLNDLVTVHQAHDPDYSQRRLIEDMIRLYAATNPHLVETVNRMRLALGQEPLDVPEWNALAGTAETTASLSVDFAAAEQKVAAGLGLTAAAMPDVLPPAPPIQTSKANLVQTVRYIGRPQLHLYDPGSKNSTGCGLAGHIDMDTIQEQSPDAVDCKKCRYCRRAVFQ